MRIQYHQRPHASLPNKVYLLDLDNTLHLAARHILPEINRKMTQYIADALSITPEKASLLRTQYWQRYGATLLGLMKHHNTNPHHFLAQTHQFTDLHTQSGRHGSVPYRLARLNGLRIMLTNAPRAYAVDVCKTLGLYRYFHAIVSIEDMVVHGQWRPKPSTWLWANLRKQLKSQHILLADDTFGHLKQAARQGIETVWVTNPGLGFKPISLNNKVKRRIHQFEAVRRHSFTYPVKLEARTLSKRRLCEF